MIEKRGPAGIPPLGERGNLQKPQSTLIGPEAVTEARTGREPKIGPRDLESQKRGPAGIPPLGERGNPVEPQPPRSTAVEVTSNRQPKPGPRYPAVTSPERVRPRALWLDAGTVGAVPVSAAESSFEASYSGPYGPMITPEMLQGIENVWQWKGGGEVRRALNIDPVPIDGPLLAETRKRHGAAVKMLFDAAAVDEARIEITAQKGDSLRLLTKLDDLEKPGYLHASYGEATLGSRIRLYANPHPELRGHALAYVLNHFRKNDMQHFNGKFSCAGPENHHSKSVDNKLDGLVLFLQDPEELRLTLEAITELDEELGCTLLQDHTVPLAHPISEFRNKAIRGVSVTDTPPGGYGERESFSSSRVDRVIEKAGKLAKTEDDIWTDSPNFLAVVANKATELALKEGIHPDSFAFSKGFDIKALCDEANITLAIR